MSDQKPVVAPKIRALADRIRAAAGGCDDKGQLRDDNTFRKIATEDGRDVDQMISDQDYVSDYLASNRLAAGESALEFMKENKDVPIVSGSFEIGRNRFEVSFERHKRVPNRFFDKETDTFKVDGEVDLYGSSNIGYKVRGAKASKGEMKAVGNFLQDQFKTAFSS